MGSNVAASWAEFWQTPVRLRIYLALVVVAALVVPFVADLGPDRALAPEWLTVGMLIVVSALNVEISRWLSGGLERTQQPHKALSAWAFACALLLPTPWLLVVVPVTYAHARWRGLRVPLWKWVGSGAYLVLCGVAAAVLRHQVMGHEPNWMLGDGGRGLVAMALAAVAFLAMETLLFSGSVQFNHAEDEEWLRRTLSSSSFYLTESAVLIMGGLLAAVWTGGPWFVLVFLPLYTIIQRAALHEPLRERAEAAALLAEKNHELEQANQFKIDLMGMLGHEIGNPLTAVQGYAQLTARALSTGNVGKAEEYVGIVDRNAATMRNVLREILTLVTSERGALTAYPEECPLEPRIVAAVDAHSNGTRPRVECADGLTAFVQPSHLDQILSNLLSNAEKYGEGATCVSAQPTADGIEIAVTDGGPGVAEPVRAYLFQQFMRDAETAQKVTGTGLGLFISRELARANGGDLVHRAGEPTGAVFVLTLPMAAKIH
ncbi:MAG TPA: HAMP domain-containing sensor histidine kinase [Nocardioidaceae bacterium]|nr:HAMP domain-containing sensor histidine kinase [Nocardioidaceae bacterium]